MALDTIEIARLEIAKIYIAAFNRVPDANGLSNWMNQYLYAGMSYEEIAQDFTNQAEYIAEYPALLTNTEYVAKIYLNVFGRAADAGGLANWANQLQYSATTGIDRGNIMNRMIEVACEAGNTDGERLDNQASFGVQSILDEVPTDIATAQLVNITSVDATVTTATAAVAAYAGTITGTTFTLTTGTDSGTAFTGGNGNDTFNADVGLVLNSTTGLMVTTDTMQATDVIVGGAGVDTLNYKTAGTVALGSISGVEVINASSLAALTLNTSTITDLTNLNITKAVGAIAATAAATTDVAVAISENGTASALANTIFGGKDVTVNATKMGTAAGANADTIAVGTGGTAPVGDVVVNQTGAAYTAATADSTLSAINVTGGKTISVTQKATSDLTAAATDVLNATITQGAVTITANTTTTAVTVKQDAAVTAVNAAATTGGVTETASVKFGALTAAATLTAGGITLTAVTAMTATEVAAAFANLVNDAAKGTLLAGDTQSGAAYTKGTYSANFTAWTSGAASGDTVVFTSTTANNTTGDLTFVLGGTVGTSVAPVVTTTQGKPHDATITGGVMGVVAGQVNVTGDAALTTVTVDGYSAAASTILGATNTALATINLSNGGAMAVTSAASTLAMNLEKVSGAVTFTTAPATLNINSIGNNTIGTLTAAATTALNVSGTGTLSAATNTLTNTKTIVVTETAGLNLGTTVLPAALESVNTTGTTGTVTLNIDGTKATYTGGAGVDNVTVNNASTTVAKAIDLGAGNDKLTLAGGSVLVPTVELKGGEGIDTLSIDATSAAVANLSANLLFAGKVTGFEKLELTAATTNNVNVEKLGNYNYVISNSASGTVAVTITDLANNGTLEIANGGATNTGHTVAIKDAATGTADNLNIVLNNTAAATNNMAAGTVTAANVETVKVTTTDATPTNVATGAADINTNSMKLTADKATALTIDGNAGLNLTLTGTNVLATVTATDMTAALTLDLSAHNGVAVTVNGGSGADVLTATFGANAKADVLNGGAGNDVLTAGTNGAKLTGGAGNDLFVLASTGTGTDEATTHSYITDFMAGDLLQLAYDVAGTATVVKSFTKLAANQSANAVYSDYVNAAMAQMVTTTAGTAGDAVWFSFAGNSYVIVDSGVETTGAFTNGKDLAIELTGVANLDNASFNSTYGTIAIG